MVQRSPAASPAVDRSTNMRVMSSNDAYQSQSPVLNFGGLVDGYGSDTSRTVHVGEPGKAERRVRRSRMRGTARPASTPSGREPP